MAIRWVSGAWERDVERSTRAHCFQKGMVLPLKNRQATEGEREREIEHKQKEEREDDLEEEQAKIRKGIERTNMQLMSKRRVARALQVDDYIASSDEEIYDPEADIALSQHLARAATTNSKMSQDLPRLVGNLTVLPLQWQYMSACLEIKHICKVDFKSHLESTPKPKEAFASPGYDGSKLYI
jgi:hypothetical protein